VPELADVQRRRVTESSGTGAEANPCEASVNNDRRGDRFRLPIHTKQLCGARWIVAQAVTDSEKP
jgi:hypothetical protein